jgi:hypothetical protein
MAVPTIDSAFAAGSGQWLLWLLMNHKTLGFISGAVACFLIWRTSGRFRGQKTLVALAALMLFARAIVFLLTYDSWDFQVFYRIGLDVLRGADPYVDVLSQYPLSALPLFATIALAPVPVAQALWYGFNLVSLMLIVRLAQKIVHVRSAFCWSDDAPVTLAVLLSGATTWGLDAGQLVVWTVLSIYAAIAMLGKGRQTAAGMSLAASTVKIATALPFFMLLLDRRRWKAVVAFGATLLALCLCMYGPGRVPQLLAENVSNMKLARQVGEINDYSFSGPYHDDMIGLERWLYCLGLHDPVQVSVSQVLILLVLCLLLLWDFRVRSNPGCEVLFETLLCVFSCVFLYHRIYDSLILTLPLFYCVAQARESGKTHGLVYKAIATGLILVMNLPRGAVLHKLATWTMSHGLAGRLVQIIVLPVCTWILLAAFCWLWLLGRRQGKEEATGRLAATQASYCH